MKKITKKTTKTEKTTKKVIKKTETVESWGFVFGLAAQKADMICEMYANTHRNSISRAGYSAVRKAYDYDSEWDGLIEKLMDDMHQYMPWAVKNLPDIVAEYTSLMKRVANLHPRNKTGYDGELSAVDKIAIGAGYHHI